MSESASSSAAAAAPPSVPVDLRDPYLAALLAWLVPGAGHWYQHRRSKAILFFLCIVGTFGYGLWLGEGRVVYAAWGPTSEDKRLPFLCQAGVGVAALPALYQARRFGNDAEYDAVQARKAADKAGFWDTFMVPPRPPKPRQSPDELDMLNKTLNRRFELGTVYTMIAGLLNLLVVFDAFGGPAYTALGKRVEPSTAKPGKKDEKPPGPAS